MNVHNMYVSVCVCVFVYVEQKRSEQWIKDVISIVLFSYSHSMDMKRLCIGEQLLFLLLYPETLKRLSFCVYDIHTYIAVDRTCSGHITIAKRDEEKGFYTICLD